MSYIGNQPAPTNIPIANLDGVTATNTELNFVDGVTSAIQTQVDAKQPYATIAVTVVDSGGNKYALDGTVQQLGLLTPSVTYRFDQSDSSNSGHPLLLSTTSNGTHGGGSAFTTGVTAVGTPGSAGAYTQVKLEQDAPDTLYYYCSSHSGMGGEVDVRATVSSLSDLSVTATAAELNIMDGVTATAAELNYVDGVTSAIQTQIDTKAAIASPTFTGTPAAPTAGAGTNTTQIATTAFVNTEVANLVDSSPSALNTLNELAAAINDDASFSTTITNSIATKLPLAGGTMTGALVINNTLDIEEVYEKVTTQTSTTGTIAFDTTAQGIEFYTANQTANRTINFSNVNSNLAIGQSLTVAIAMTQGSTAYYLNAYQIDGNAVTPKWSGGSAPSAGNASSIDSYSFTIIKTANATFTVLASLTQYA